VGWGREECVRSKAPRTTYIKPSISPFPFSGLRLLYFIFQACRPPSLPPFGPHLDVVVFQQDDFRRHIGNVHDLHHHHALGIRVQLFVETALQALGLVPCDGGEAFLALGRLMMMMVMKQEREGGMLGEAEAGGRRRRERRTYHD